MSRLSEYLYGQACLIIGALGMWLALTQPWFEDVVVVPLRDNCAVVQIRNTDNKVLYPDQTEDCLPGDDREVCEA